MVPFPFFRASSTTPERSRRRRWGSHRADFDDAEKRAGVTRETWTIETAPDGSSFVLVWFEARNPEVAFTQLMDDSDHSVWFRARVKEVTGVDLSEPPSGDGPEVVVDWTP